MNDGNRTNPSEPDRDAAELALWRRAADLSSAPIELTEAELLLLAAYIDGAADAEQSAAAEALMARSSEARAIVREARLAGSAQASAEADVTARMLERAVGLNPARESASPGSEQTDRGRSAEPVLAKIRDWLVPAGGWGLAAAASIAVCFVGFRLGAGDGATGANVVRTAGSDELLADFSLGYFETGWTEDDEDPLYWDFNVNGEGSA